MKVEHTGRGFERIDFTDAYGELCSLQQSSLAVFEKPGSGAVWLGTNENRMHLTHDQVEELTNHLLQWLENGSLEITDTVPKDTQFPPPSSPIS